VGDILFLAHRIPFPPDRGDKIRSHHVLKALARLAPVHVATFADDEDDHRFEADLAALSASHCLVHRGKPLALAGVESLLTGRPLSLAAFDDKRLRAYVHDLLLRCPIEVIYVFSGQMAQYVPAGFAGRVVTDLVDVDSEKFAAYGAQGSGFRAWMERREARLLGAEEARVAGTSAVTLLISEAEAELLRARPSIRRDGVRAMGNGMDANFYDPAAAEPDPAMLASGAPRIVFTGQMDYAPNIAAVTRAIDRILPLVRERCPGATFHVVGRNPPPALIARSGRDGVNIVGRVEDVRVWLKAADIALVPLEIARGVQNKVLEAMAMELPVVLSPGAATGIAAHDGEHFLVAESDAELADAIVALAGDPARRQAMGLAARAWIMGHASWPAALDKLPEFCGMARRRLDDAA